MSLYFYLICKTVDVTSFLPIVTNTISQFEEDTSHSIPSVAFNRLPHSTYWRYLELSNAVDPELQFDLSSTTLSLVGISSKIVHSPDTTPTHYATTILWKTSWFFTPLKIPETVAGRSHHHFSSPLMSLMSLIGLANIWFWKTF